MNYTIQQLSKDNFHHLINLYGQIFPENNDTELLEKKFQIFNEEIKFGFLAFDKNQDVSAFYGVFPYHANFSGQTIKIAQSGNTMTGPDHRKKGLFKRLHDETMKLCKEHQINFVFGFPNANSAPGFEKFGWRARDCNKYSWISNLGLTEKVKRKINWDNYYEQKKKVILKHETNPEEIDISLSFLSQNSTFSVERNLEYLIYKASLGSRFIKLHSGVAWVKITNNTIQIADVFGTNPMKIFDELVSFSRKIGIEMIIFVTSNNEDLFNRLSSTPPSNCDKNHISLIVNELLPMKNDSLDLQFTSGDFDTF